MAHMRKLLAVVGGIIVIITALFTSTSLKEFTMSAESKINAAVPASEKLRLTQTAVFETASAAQWKSIEEELETRMKIRALRCAKGYTPPFYVRIKAARKNLTDLPCFNETDNEIAQWLSLKKVGVMLGKPALKPVPSVLPSYIVADASIQNLNFADNAGIVLLETPSAIQIIDIGTQKPILREMKGASIPGRISANGRLFVTGEGNRLKVRDTESGSIITELNDVSVKSFYWLDESSALYNKSSSDKTFIVDFAAGKEMPVQAINKKLIRVARLGQSTNQFAVFSADTIAKIELVRTQAGLDVKLRDEKQDPLFAAKANTSGISSDGNYFFNVDRQVNVVALGTLTAYSVPLDAFIVRFAVATSDPDKILLIGAQDRAAKAETNNRLFSISERSITPFPNTRIDAQRYRYANALRREAMISENKIALTNLFPEMNPDIAKAGEAEATTAASLPVKKEAKKTDITNKDQANATNKLSATPDAAKPEKKPVTSSQSQTPKKEKAASATEASATTSTNLAPSAASSTPASHASGAQKTTPAKAGTLPKKSPASSTTIPKKQDLSQTS